MITTTLKDALNDNFDGPNFLRLLHNYGVWARYFGAVGYLQQGSLRETCVIDDDTALIIDRAMQSLKDNWPKLFRLLTWYYVNDLDEGDILSVMMQKPTKKYIEYRKNYYAASPYDKSDARYLSQKDIRKLIIVGEKHVYSYLKDMVEETCKE